MVFTLSVFILLYIGHPRFLNQLYGGLDTVSLAGEMITAITNTNIHTYEVAPFYILVEEAILNKIGHMFGWQQPFDGIFSPGRNMEACC
jgi:glutamate/tyrosine decarboxylase-like PLP-dependent enzyme